MNFDSIRKRYFSDNRRYADLINGYLLGGRQLIESYDITELDSQTYDAKGVNSRNRDLIRKTAFGVNFVVIGIENQEKVHYLMPLRTLLYDGAEYTRQVAQKRHNNRNNNQNRQSEQKKRERLSDSEFLSGFAKTDRLMPCITIVKYFGEEWDASRDLYDLLDMTDIPDELQPYINHYPVHLLEVCNLMDTSVFHTDLRQVFEFIRNSKDKNKLKKLIESDSEYRHLDEDAFDMIAACTNAGELARVKESYREREGINMCVALTELIEEGRTDGVKIGIEKLSTLNKQLIEQKRYEDLNKAQFDEQYREELFEEFGL